MISMNDTVTRSLARRAKAALAALCLMSCVAAGDAGTGNDNSNQDAQPETLEQLEAAIMAEIGTPRAESAAQCRAIGFGAKPCGGPWRYLIYSTTASNEARLKDLVARYNALEQKRNADEGRVSDCRAVPEPGVTVANGLCVSGSAR